MTIFPAIQACSEVGRIYLKSTTVIILKVHLKIHELYMKSEAVINFFNKLVKIFYMKKKEKLSFQKNFTKHGDKN